MSGETTKRRCPRRIARAAGTIVIGLAGCGKSPKANEPAAPAPVPGSAVVRPIAAGTGGSGGDLEQGRAVFEGKGHCTVCHSIDRADPAGRGPDLADIGRRAGERAAGFGLTGQGGGVLYLLRAITHPAAEVVEGYNPMPESWLPCRLEDVEIRSLVLYLNSLGGPSAPPAFALQEDWLAAKRQEYEREQTLLTSGDPERGFDLFHDPKGNAGCIKCHTIDGEGADICPDLSTVNLVQRPGYVLQSILDSSAFIVHGYRQLMIWDHKGIMHVGLPKGDDAEAITLVINDQGTTDVVPKQDIDEQQFSEVSIMPGNLADLLSGQEVMDLVAYVLGHEGIEPPPPPEEAARAGGGDEPDLEHATAAAPPPPPPPAAAPPPTVPPTVSPPVSPAAPPPAPPATASPPPPPPSLEVFGKPTENQRRYRMAMEKGDAVIGSRIYAHYCTMCHGTDGTGTGFNAVNLETKPANHTDDRRMSKTDDRLLQGVIAQGGMKTGRSFLMPPWGGTFSPREMWDLVAYLRHLHTDRARGSRRRRN